jgi:myo-inositol-1(or 4)-monophosphatase
MTDYADLLPVAHEAADFARDYVLTHHPGTLVAKGERDMASEVDYAIERQLRAMLTTATPGAGFVGEEDGAEKGSTALAWAVDPVDGTVNFTHGHPLVCNSIALLFEGRPVLGIIDSPFLGQRYWAVEGQGAFRDGDRIHASATDQISQALVAVGDYAVGTDADSRNALRLALTGRLAARVQRIRMHGTAAMDFAWLASGTIDALVMLANNTWDVAAGTVIAREAGALVVDATGNEHNSQSDTTLGIAPGLRDEFIALVTG